MRFSLSKKNQLHPGRAVPGNFQDKEREMRTNFKAAVLRETLDITRALVARGYYPYNVKFNGDNEGLSLEARGLIGNEGEKIKDIEMELAAITSAGEGAVN
jgi:hypothetical protein